jgi:cytochrome c-type biogenesis protein CcmE
MEKKNNKVVYGVALALLVAGLGFLLASGLSSNSVYFLNVSEALATEPAKLSAARLFGKVDPADLTGGAGQTFASFRLVDKDNPGQSIWVDYKGAVPDTFKPGVEVIVEGGLRPGASRFSATTLITKCPSKYEKMRSQG